jgi:formate hydrogenlyase transcriptional activator
MAASMFKTFSKAACNPVSVSGSAQLMRRKLNAVMAGRSAERPCADINARYKVLTEIGRTLIHNLAQETILESISALIGQLVAFDRIALMVYEPQTDSRRIFAMAGRSRSRLSTVGTELTRTLQSYAWQAFDRQQPVLSNLSRAPQLPLEQRLYREGLRSLVALPLILGGKAIGTLNLASETLNRYGKPEIAFLEEVTYQIALAIGNIRSHQKIATLRAALEKDEAVIKENKANSLFPEIIGKSTALKKVLYHADAAAGADCTVLITGETGSGKEPIARAIHERSRRKDKPFVAVSCSALPSGLVESELFGHEKGAFTGATARRIGRFEMAEGGTLFLDEVGEIPPEVQVKLLRVLQQREFERLGGTQTLKVDVRVIAATNRDLAREMAEKKFRSDLYYRLNVFPISVPPLRERRDDVPLLVRYFVDKYSRKAGKHIERIREEAMESLKTYDWPGNIRELENVVERAVILTHGPVLNFPEEIMFSTNGSGAAGQSLTLKEVERNHIEHVLRKTHGVLHGPNGAARLLGINPSTLRSRMKKLGLSRHGDISQES